MINGYSAKLSGAALEHVLNDPAVDYVEENGAFKIDWIQEQHVEPRLGESKASNYSISKDSTLQTRTLPHWDGDGVVGRFDFVDRHS